VLMPLSQVRHTCVLYKQVSWFTWPPVSTTVSQFRCHCQTFGRKEKNKTRLRQIDVKASNFLNKAPDSAEHCDQWASFMPIITGILTINCVCTLLLARYFLLSSIPPKLSLHTVVRLVK